MKYPYIAGVTHKGQNHFYKVYVDKGEYYTFDNLYSHILYEKGYNQCHLEDITEEFFHCTIIEVTTQVQLELLKALVDDTDRKSWCMRELGYYCFNPTGYYIHFLTEKAMKDHIDRTNSDKRKQN